MMQQQRKRDAVKTQTGDLGSYLESLNLRATMRPATDRDLPRVAQLIQKTNQFNLSLKRRTLDEIRGIDGESNIFIISAADRFGDYGQIGVVIIRRSASGLEIDTFLLSCRALGRGLENLILRELIRFAKRQGITEIVAPFVTGPRNAPVLEFFSRAGFTSDSDRFIAPTSLEIEASKIVNWSFEDQPKFEQREVA